ncbi:ATP-binding cassette domain-containing protein [Candidatus Woesearchaeota archaeon]|nr:ATP-binding cassette domain-containing protein [Candidatus Woesearchaeota archaeon]
MFSIKVKDLTKKFGDFTAVNKISFSVKEGEIFGLLGPNGAGKTTTINMLSTLIEPSSGYGEVAGFNIQKKQDDVRNSIGIVFQDPAVDANLTGRENLDFHGMIYNLSKKERKKRINDVLDLVELKDKANVMVEDYSGGMRRRLEIGRGLMHEPKVLFLDAPTLGLDAQTRRHIWDYVKKLNKKSKVTIILTTHYMEEADYLCDRVAIIDHGKIMALDTPQKLKDSLGGDVIMLETEGDSENLMNILRKVKWISTIKRKNGSVALTMLSGEKRIPELIEMAHKAEVKIISVSLHKPSLEDVFLHFTGKTIREEEANTTDRNREVMRMRMRR